MIMTFKGYYSSRVAGYLLDVPLDYLTKEISKAMKKSGDPDIELKTLKKILLQEIPFLRLQLADDTQYPVLNESNAHEIVQELMFQHCLDFSEQEHKDGLYFRVVGKDEIICACQIYPIRALGSPSVARLERNIK